MMPPAAHSPSPGGTGYEASDINPRAVVYVLAVVLSVIILLGPALYWLVWYDTPPGAHVATSLESVATLPMNRPPPPPRQQITPEADLARVVAREQAALESYGLVDTHTARIPIERAMELLVRRGLPAVGGPPASPNAPKEQPPTDNKPAPQEGSP